MAPVQAEVGSLLSEADGCGRALLRLLSRGHAVTAELQRVADALPSTLLGDSDAAKRLAPVLPDFAVFRSERAIERVATTPELIELDEESRDLHERFARRAFQLLAAIRKYAADVRRLFERLDAGAYVSRSLASVLRDADGAQLLPEAVALLGAQLLLLEERLPGPVRERALVLFYRCTVGTADESDDFADVCRLFKCAGRPPSADLAQRPPGYPELFFQRFPLPRDAVRVVIGRLQTDDVYGAARHYPLPEHRSHSLAAQAGLLYSILFFHAKTLESDVLAMREVVNRHFGDVWVVSFALGSTADLLAMWAPYPAAREALCAAISAESARRLLNAHLGRLGDIKRQLAEYLTEGVLTEEVATTRGAAILNCLREANTTIRWLLLQPTTQDAKLQDVFRSVVVPKERLLEMLVDTALLEERVRNVLEPFVERREATWTALQGEAARLVEGLAVYFSGEHALQRNVRNEDLESWFRDKQARIEQLSFAGHQDVLGLGRKITALTRAFEQVEDFHEIARQPHILHFLGEARRLLTRMLRTINLDEETLETITTVADLSYAWTALGAYQEAMHGLLAQSPDSVKGLRALFLKLASILEAPMRRIRQAGNASHYELVSGYYSARLVRFMRSTLQEIPRLLFALLGGISELQAATSPAFGSAPRLSWQEFNDYAQRSEKARHEVGALTKRVALLMRGIRETEVAVLGEIRVEPRAVLVDGLRRELARHVEALFAGVAFPAMAAGASGRPSRDDVAKPLEAAAVKAEALRRGFEHVQDYLGVSALKLWHEETARVAAVLLRRELHLLMRRRLPAEEADEGEATAVCYPDAYACAAFAAAAAAAGVDGSAALAALNKGVTSGASFLSRSVAALLGASSPTTAVGGLRGEWRDAKTGEAVLDGEVFELLYRAVGPHGIAALSRLLGLRTGLYVRGAFRSAEEVLTQETSEVLLEVVSTAEASMDGTAAARMLRATAQRAVVAVQRVSTTLATIGQHVLLRRRLNSAQRLHARLDAPMALDAFSALDGAGLADALALSEELAPAVSGAGPDDDEELWRFHRRVAEASERVGIADPLRQVYAVAAGGAALRGLSVLLAFALISAAAAIGSGGAGERRASSWGFRRRRKDAAGDSDDAAVAAEVTEALVVGAATLLQQLPRRQTDGMLGVLGLYLRALSAEVASAGGRGSPAAAAPCALAEGARLAALAEDVLQVLGLPREHFADFAPQGMLELWQAG